MHSLPPISPSVTFFKHPTPFPNEILFECLLWIFFLYKRLSYCNLNQTRFFVRLIYRNLTFCNCLVNAKNIFIKYFFHYKLHRTLTEGNLSHYISVSSKTNTLQLNKLQIKYWRLKNVKRPGSSISLISKISWASCHTSFTSSLAGFILSTFPASSNLTKASRFLFKVVCALCHVCHTFDRWVNVA